MKLTKKQETNIWQVYDTWLDSYLNGDVTTYDKYLDKDYHFIGSTNNEEFLSKKDTINFFKATADQLAGKTQLRNETKVIEKFEELVFITHLFDAWFLNGTDWNYYGRFRFSNALKKNKEGWCFIYQHFSMPDSKAQEGESIGYDQISAENLQLREAIQRRTVELEAKNRELEIEGALERIRAQAVAMKTSTDLLDIVVTMRNEFTKLGHEAHYFWHMMWLKDNYEKAMTSGDGTKIGMIMKLPRHMHGDIPVLAKWEKSKKPIIVYPMDAETAMDYVDKMITLGDFQQVDPQAPSLDDVRHIGGLTFIMARTTHGEIGFSLPGVVKNPPVEALKLLEQFAGAFDLAHRRFLDLQKAEKQRREVEIALALEKVRSRTMGMQRSDELRDTAMLLFQQIEELGINSFACGFNIWDDDKKAATAWMASTYGLQPPFKTNSAEDVYLLFFEEEKRGESLFILEQKGKELEDHYKYLKTIPEVKNLSDAGVSFPTYQIIHCAYFSKGYLMFITLEPVPDAHDIFKRFAKVFEQTYTRFLDLQKAEAQAREAKIEAALERVRSRTMAMQNSTELAETSIDMFKQMQTLGMRPWACGFNIFEKDEKAVTQWMSAVDGGLQTPFTTPLTENPFFIKISEARQRGEELFVMESGGQELEETYTYMFNLPGSKKALGNILASGFEMPKFQISHCAFFSQGYLMFITYEPYPEAYDVFKRFAKVFEQTYTRFLDLQKAEAQAREAQIEAALERVRSRTMAMQHSTELSDTSALLFQQIQRLGVPPWSCGFNIWEKEDTVFTSYMGSPDGGILKGYKIPLTEEATFIHFKESRNRGDKLFIDVLEGDTLETHYRYFQTLPGIKEIFEKRAQAGFPIPTFQINHLANFSHGNLMFITYEHCPEAHDIFIRFAKVFEQTYTRFLDLQKAEKQTREAQINLAVERVRAKALAMHKSEEIMEVVAKLKEEIMGLDIPDVIAATIFLSEGEDRIRMWDLSTLEKLEEGYQVPLDITFKLKEKDPHLYVKRVWENPENYFVEIQDKKGFKRIMAWLREYNKNEVADEVEAYLEASKIKCLYHAAKKLNNGKLVLDLLDPPTTEIETILTKMGTAFDLAYKRFEDLQKAEAQARDAQIEAALERVRSRTMAMHKSEDLNQAASDMFKEIHLLGMNPWACGFNIFDKDETMVTQYMSLANGSVSPPFKTPLTEDPFFINIYEASLRRDELLVWESEGKSLAETYNYMFGLPGSREIFGDLENSGFEMPKFQITHCAFFSQGYLVFITYKPVPDSHDIFKRFAKVFEQTYTRFLDLQKAEKQAKESEIELALERVRARTMAMQHSDELQEASFLLDQQVRALGIKTWGCAFNIYGENDSTEWFGNEAGVLPTYTVPWNGIFKEYYQKGQKGESLLIKEFSGKACVAHYEYMSSLPIIGEVLRKLKEANNGFPTYQIDHVVYFKYGYLLFISREPVPDAHDIFKRFAKVFEQTYTRFLDLQKSEAQAKEAQIESALERVRSRSLAMHNTLELQEVIHQVHKELLDLDISINGGSFITINDDIDDEIRCWGSGGTANTSEEIKIPRFEKPFYLNLLNGIRKEKGLFTEEYTQEEKREFFTHLLKFEPWSKLSSKKKKEITTTTGGYTRSCYVSKHTSIFIINHFGIKFRDDENEILKRFTKVFEQAYTRFLDLQKAEAQTREAQIEAALERVRSRTMAMQNSSELSKTASVLFKQLIELGIEPNRLYIAIIKDKKGLGEFWITNEDGSKVSSGFTTNLNDNPTMVKMLIAWKENKKSLTIDMKGKELKAYFNYLSKMKVPFIGGLSQKRRVQNLAFFSQGFIGIASPKPEPKETLKLLERFASVFNLTYTRFNDLQLSEAHAKQAEKDLILLQTEKRKAEDALSELQQTQKQLIQSEKMASLGELTAGIAHEIQNPLNFVNNFSEVSQELIDELKEELELGNMEDVTNILNDIVQNLQKINHHGKRADAIVKGMLQHSRKSSAVKEITDINNLCDEFLRLSYHGLRAKDKSFNATLVTDFDENSPKANIFPQDMGRVVLNLLTNAFYAVNKKKQLNITGYKPTVSIGTKGYNGTVEIKVSDNGNGIPKHVLDKIYQPFFTTKPTGEGTGLGLSMSYDIVTKGHGGELKAKTKDGVGSVFIIQLPL